MSNKIPNDEIKELTDKYVKIKLKVMKLEEELDTLASQMANLYVGSYGPLTVYKVGKVKVKGYIRSAYKAVRIKTKN